MEARLPVGGLVGESEMEDERAGKLRECGSSRVVWYSSAERVPLACFEGQNPLHCF